MGIFDKKIKEVQKDNENNAERALKLYNKSLK